MKRSLPLVLILMIGCGDRVSLDSLYNKTPLPPTSGLSATDPPPDLGLESDERDLADVLTLERVVPLELTDQSIIASISDVSADARGILVLDQKQGAVFAFDADGRFLKQIGRPGHGPGELISPTAIQMIGNRIAISDQEHRKILLFDREGRFQSHLDLTDHGIMPGIRFAIDAQRLYLSNPIYVSPKGKPVNLIVDLETEKILWGFEKPVPNFQKTSPPVRFGRTSFSLIDNRVWVGAPHTRLVRIFDLEGRFVAELEPGIEGSLELGELSGKKNYKDILETREQHAKHERIIYARPFVLVFFALPGRFGALEPFERFSIFDGEGRLLAKNLTVSNLILHRQLFRGVARGIVGVSDINFYSRAYVDKALPDRDKEIFEGAGWQVEDLEESEDNPYVLFFTM